MGSELSNSMARKKALRRVAFEVPDESLMIDLLQLQRIQTPDHARGAVNAFYRLLVRTDTIKQAVEFVHVVVVIGPVIPHKLGIRAVAARALVDALGPVGGHFLA